MLSGLVVGVTGAALASVEQALASPPFTLRALGTSAAIGAVAGLVHWLNAWGTKDAVLAKTFSGGANQIEKDIEKAIGRETT